MKKLQDPFNEKLDDEELEAEELEIQAYYEEQAAYEEEAWAARAENYDFDYGDYRY